MQRTRKRKRPTQLLEVSCSRCEAKCYVEWKPFDAATNTNSDIKDPALFHRELELFSYTICEDCTPIVSAVEQQDQSLTVFTSHINPSVIQSSSHPHIIPICKYLRHPLHEPIQPFVPDDLNEGLLIARTWFQQATYVLVLAGAGMSADAGLSVFRYQLIPIGSGSCSGSDNNSNSSNSSSNSSSSNNNHNSSNTQLLSKTLVSTATAAAAANATATATTTVATLVTAATTITTPLPLLGGGLTTEEVDYRARPEKAW